MKSSVEGRLIHDLLAEPRKFDEDGRAYALLQSYWAGFPLDTLRPLLRSDNVFVQRAASFIASELGSKASDIVDDRFFELLGQRHERHQQGLLALTAENRVGPAVIATMLKDGDALVRRYGAIAARRFVQEYPDLMAQVRSSEDPDLRSL